MKKINESVEWALHCCVVIAGSNRPLTVDRLSYYHDIPRDYLAKALQALSKAGVLTAVRGNNGGYRLARPARSIRVLDIVQVLEPGPRFHCTEIRQNGPTSCPASEYKTICSVHRLMSEAETAWAKVLEEATLHELAVSAARNAPKVQVQRTVKWINE